MQPFVVHLSDRAAARALLRAVQPGDPVQLRLIEVRLGMNGAASLTVDVVGLDETEAESADAMPEAGAPARTPVSPTRGLEHDPFEQRFFLQGEPLPLSDHQYRLLRHFVEHDRQVLSEAQLREAVWDWRADDADSDVVASLVYRLRQQLGSEAAGLIQTRRGAGYCFVP